MARRTEQEVLRIGGSLLGLLNSEPTALVPGSSGRSRDLEERIAERERARRERRFTDADRIRGELALKASSWKTGGRYDGLARA